MLGVMEGIVEMGGLVVNMELVVLEVPDGVLVIKGLVMMLVRVVLKGLVVMAGLVVMNESKGLEELK